MGFRIAPVLVVLVALAYAASARAAYFSPHFDPQFNGNVLFQIGDPCLAQADATYPSFGSCEIDLVSANISDLTHPLDPPYTSGAQLDVGILVTIAANQVGTFSTVGLPLSCGASCSGELQFFLGSCDGDCTGSSATLSNSRDETLTDGYDVVPVAVPEPGPLWLLAIAACAWGLALRRRRARVLRER